MDYVQMKQWLDALVDNLEEKGRLVDFNNRIRTHMPDKTIFLNGIDEVADIMGIELQERKLSEDLENRFKYEYSFMYRGIKFKDYVCERMESFAGADRKSDGC